jgi:hypothetical protein
MKNPLHPERQNNMSNGVERANKKIAAGVGVFDGELQLANKKQDHHDNQHQPKAAAGVRSPAGAITPSGEGADQE